MIHKKDILQMARKISRRQAGLHDYQIMHPTREWLLGVGIASSIFLVGAATSAQLYFSNKNTALQIDAPTEEVIVYRESVVEAALTRLSDREAVFNQLKNNRGNSQPTLVIPPVEAGVGSSTVATTSPSVATSSPAIIPVVEEPTDSVTIPAPL